MKNTKWVGLVAALAFSLFGAYAQTPAAPVPGAPAQAQAVAPVNLSPGAAEVVRLASSGVGDEVVLAYIQNSQTPFTLAADDVLYLKDIGLSPQVTSAMLTHDNSLRNQAQQYAPAAPASPAPPGNAPLTQDWQAQGAPPAPAQTGPPPNPGPQPNQGPPPTYVTSAPTDVSYFYNDLAPYGTWVSLEGYGWCWQPRTVVVSRAWRPYFDGGHWVYTDAGWYWQSDYSWGWAPFHYGRWYAHPSCGWVWTPDRVWGPAWVTWRTGGDACGWAPLPPRAVFDVRLGWRYNGVSVGANFDFGLGINAFAFVSFGDFGHRDLGHRRLPPARVTNIYRQTTVINNYTVNNNTIVNRGIPIERVSAASRVPVPRATVRDLPAGSNRRPSQGGSVVYRAQPQAPARPATMVAQRLDTSRPVIRHAPVTAVRTERPATFNRSGSAPGAASRPSAVEATRTSTRSSAATISSSPQHPTTAGSRQSTPTTGTSPGLSRLNSGKPAPSATTIPSQQHPSTAGSYQPAPATAIPQGSPWSGGTKPVASPQSKPTARTYQPAPAIPPAATTPRAPDEWKQGSRPAPGYRSDAGLPAYYNARRASQSPPATTATTQTPAEVRNPHVYQPKSQQQAAEVRALPKTDQRRSDSPSSRASNPDARSQKNQR